MIQVKKQMKKWIFGLSLLLLMSSSAKASISLTELPEGEELFPESTSEVISYEGHYYSVFDEPMSWDDAKADCERRGGYLVCINSLREQQFIQTAVVGGNKPYYWIGLTDSADEGNFRWVNGDPLEYKNWGTAQPDDWQESEDSVMLPNRDREYAEWSNAFGTWNDMNSLGDRDHALSEMGYICEWDSIATEQAEVLSGLMDDLGTALRNQGVAAETDNVNGTVTLDSAILFDLNSYQVGAQGQEVIRRLMDAFGTVLSTPEIQNRIASINIQGHTDSTGVYAYNVKLSIDRAEAVCSVCLDSVAGDAAQMALFSRLFTTSGCACDYPVLDADGLENMAASRRVIFVFHLKYQ